MSAERPSSTPTMTSKATNRVPRMRKPAREWPVALSVGLQPGQVRCYWRRRSLLAVPGIGPFPAVGTVAGTLGATVVGAAGVAVVGATDDADDDTAVHYRTGIDRGNAMVTVDASDDGRTR